MLTKAAFIKFALVPLVAATVLSRGVSATPSSLQIDDGAPALRNGSNWPNVPGDCPDDRFRITQPNRDTVWHVGDCQEVTWEKRDDGDGDHPNDDPGPNRRCKTSLLLRKNDDEPFLILAECFRLRRGSVIVKVPKVITGNDYRVILSFGDDNHQREVHSKRFKIIKDRHCSDDDDDGDGRECRG